MIEYLSLFRNMQPVCLLITIFLVVYLLFNLSLRIEISMHNLLSRIQMKEYMASYKEEI